MRPPPDEWHAVEIVGSGYDRMTARYLASSRPGGARDHYLERLLLLLANPSDVLELGSGAGEPVTRRLAERHRVTAVDLSAEQLRLAAERAPSVRFLQANMLDLAFEAATFDAVAAFYAITHVPRQRHADLLGRIAGWLRPRGVLLLSMGTADNPGGVEADWFGVPMYFSHYDAATNLGLVKRAGFELIEADAVEEIGPDGLAERFLWVIGRLLPVEARR